MEISVKRTGYDCTNARFYVTNVQMSCSSFFYIYNILYVKFYIMKKIDNGEGCIGLITLRPV